MHGEGADDWLDDAGRRRRTSELLVSLRELSVLMSHAIDESVGSELSTNGAVLVLSHLADQGSLRSGTIGRRAHLTRGGVSNMLRRLEESGLVTRAPGPRDGRAVWVSLTPAGRRLETQLRTAVMSALATSQSVVKDAIVSLVELGASAPPTARSSRDPARRITIAIAEAGATIAPALSRSGSVASSMALASLHADGQCRVGRLAEMLGITSGGATRLVEQLVANGYAERIEEVPDDARGVEVALTRGGELVLSDIADGLRPLLATLLAAMRSAMIDLGDAC